MTISCLKIDSSRQEKKVEDQGKSRAAKDIRRQMEGKKRMKPGFFRKESLFSCLMMIPNQGMNQRMKKKRRIISRSTSSSTTTIIMPEIDLSCSWIKTPFFLVSFLVFFPPESIHLLSVKSSTRIGNNTVSVSFQIHFVLFRCQSQLMM